MNHVRRRVAVTCENQVRLLDDIDTPRPRKVLLRRFFRASPLGEKLGSDGWQQIQHILPGEGSRTGKIQRRYLAGLAEERIRQVCGSESDLAVSRGAEKGPFVGLLPLRGLLGIVDPGACTDDGLFVRARRPAKSHGWGKVLLGPLNKSQFRARKNGTEIFRPIQVIAPPIGFDDVGQTVVERQARAHAPRILNVTAKQVIWPGLGFPVVSPPIGVPDPNRQRPVNGKLHHLCKTGRARRRRTKSQRESVIQRGVLLLDYRRAK